MQTLYKCTLGIYIIICNMTSLGTHPLLNWNFDSVCVVRISVKSWGRTRWVCDPSVQTKHNPSTSTSQSHANLKFFRELRYLSRTIVETNHLRYWDRFKKLTSPNRRFSIPMAGDRTPTSYLRDSSIYHICHTMLVANLSYNIEKNNTKLYLYLAILSNWGHWRSRHQRLIFIY